MLLFGQGFVTAGHGRRHVAYAGQILAAGGRTFFLFTSHRALREAVGRGVQDPDQVADLLLVPAFAQLGWLRFGGATDPQ